MSQRLAKPLPGQSTDMSNADDQQTTDAKQHARQRAHAGMPKDDEQLTKEHIQETGEPNRDALGNQDGAS
jgi:hypothetical protein